MRFLSGGDKDARHKWIAEVLKVKVHRVLRDTPLFGEVSHLFGYLASVLANYLANSRFVVFAKVVASSVPVAVYFELFCVSCLCFV